MTDGERKELPQINTDSRRQKIKKHVGETERLFSIRVNPCSSVAINLGPGKGYLELVRR